MSTLTKSLILIHPTNPIQTTTHINMSSNPPSEISHTNTSNTNTTSTSMNSPSDSNLVIINETDSIVEQGEQMMTAEEDFDSDVSSTASDMAIDTQHNNDTNSTTTDFSSLSSSIHVPQSDNNTVNTEKDNHSYKIVSRRSRHQSTPKSTK